MARIGLCSPWVRFYRELEEMFKPDPGVRVIFNEDAYEIKLYVEDGAKASALEQLLPSEKNCGNVVLRIMVVPPNEPEESTDLFKDAFDGNPVLSYIRTVKGVFVNDITYIVFQNKVVQYFDDDLGDVNGQCSTLYQEIAKNIFGETEGVFFCTDLPLLEKGEESLGYPLGEWP